MVSLCFAFMSRDKLYFVMPFYRGGELFQHLKINNFFPEKQSKLYAAQIFLGLSHLHSKNIIYRDLKPENILLDIDGNLAMTDFGMAKQLKESQTTNSLVGTPEYIAPEILN